MFNALLDKNLDSAGKRIFPTLIDRYGYKPACQGILKSLEYNQKYGSDKIPGDIDGTGSFAFREHEGIAPRKPCSIVLCVVFMSSEFAFYIHVTHVL